MKKIGLDVGDVRIGIAVSDMLGICANSRESYRRVNDDVDIQYFIKLAREENADTFVVGLPINMDGTAIYQAVATIFIAACYNIDLTLADMAMVVLTATLASVGTAGVSGAGMIMLAMVLTSIGIPVEGIAIIAGVDKLFDMGRTTLNITGDATCAIWISKLERAKKARMEARANAKA